MNRYLNSIITKVASTEKAEEWQNYKLLNKLQYDPTVNYFSLVVEQEILIDKKSILSQGETFINQWLSTGLKDCYEVLDKTDEYVKEKYYKWYLANSYEKWSKNYKLNSNTVQDEGLNFMFVTLNFKQGTDIKMVMVDTSRILGLPILANTKITYTYENYTNTSNHPHVHCLIELKRTGTISLSSILEKIYQHKKLRDYLAVDVKMSWAKDYEKRCQKRSICLAYVLGNKIDKKIENSENDKLWRIEHNLEQYYVKEN